MIDLCRESQQYVNNFTQKNGVEVDTYVIIPFGDPIKERYKGKVKILEGPEHDVLTRYVNLLDETDAQYVVRVTADCPLLPSYLISKGINFATRSNKDYVSNIDEMLRTFIDGQDVEVISARALRWLDQNAVTSLDREHVTVLIRKAELPSKIKIGHIIGHLYQPDIKLSVDTQEDLDRVRAQYDRIKKCIDTAVEKDGKQSVSRC